MMDENEGRGEESALIKKKNKSQSFQACLGSCVKGPGNMAGW